MQESVEKKLIELESYEKIIFDLAKKMHPGNTYPIDILINATMDRTLHLIFGFTNLLRSSNYIAACHLVRCHLDNILRLSSVWLVKEPHKLATELMSGTQLDKMIDKDGKKLKDWYLRNKLNEEYPWVKNVYEETSGFIHLSKKHIFTSSRMTDKNEGTIEMVISKHDNYVTDEHRIEATTGMIEISKILCHYIEGWIHTKNNTKPNTI
jgi:hypothetical protein